MQRTQHVSVVINDVKYAEMRTYAYNASKDILSHKIVHASPHAQMDFTLIPHQNNAYHAVYHAVVVCLHTHAHNVQKSQEGHISSFIPVWMSAHSPTMHGVKSVCFVMRDAWVVSDQGVIVHHVILVCGCLRGIVWEGAQMDTMGRVVHAWNVYGHVKFVYGRHIVLDVGKSCFSGMGCAWRTVLKPTME
jgi:hypothetical protein